MKRKELEQQKEGKNKKKQKRSVSFSSPFQQPKSKHEYQREVSTNYKQSEVPNTRSSIDANSNSDGSGNGNSGSGSGEGSSSSSSNSSNSSNSSHDDFEGKNKLEKRAKEVQKIRKIRTLKGFEQHSERLLGEEVIDQSGKIISVEGEIGSEGRRTYEDDENVMFEPFNLIEEREVGAFDENGNYVQRKKKIEFEKTKEQKKKQKQMEDDFIIEKNLPKDFTEQSSSNSSGSSSKWGINSKYNVPKFHTNQNNNKHQTFDKKIDDNHQKKISDNDDNDDDDDDNHDGNLEPDTWADNLEHEEYITLSKRSKSIHHIAESLTRNKKHTNNSLMNNLPNDGIELKFIILGLIGQEETVSEALQRLSTKKGKGAKNSFETLSEVAYRVSISGGDHSAADPDIYNKSGSEILKQVQNYQSFAQWEFKWDNKPDSQIYGPYSTQVMLSWKNQGFFLKHDAQIRQAQPHSTTQQVPAGNNQNHSGVIVDDDDDDMFAVQGDQQVREPLSTETSMVDFVPLRKINFYKYK